MDGVRVEARGDLSGRFVGSAAFGLFAAAALAWLSGCGPRAITQGEGEVVARPAGAAVIQEGEYQRLLSGSRLRASMLDQSHFVERSRQGLVTIDLGSVDAHKHINGGWRAGWRVEPAGIDKSGRTWLETDSKSARAFFKHDKGGFDRVAVRMRAARKSNKVVVYVNDESLATLQIDEAWQDYVVEVPESATRAGENQLLLRFSSEAKVDGRTQAALVDAVTILPRGMKLADAPRGEMLGQVAFGKASHAAFLAVSPQTLTWRVQLPEGASTLAMAFGAKEAGARFTVKAKADTVAQATVFNEALDGAGAGQWRYGTADLSAFAGTVVELEVIAGGKWPEGQMAALGTPAIYSPPFKDGAEAPKSPGVPAQNVLIYLIDTMRYDKFDFYNPKSKTKTPNISAFAREATIFEAAYTNENWTKPSTATILTGLYPDTHKAKEDSSKLPQSAVTIAEHLKGAGFRTGSFIANGYVSNKFGFDQGWDHYTNYIREERNTDADNVVNEALAWIDGQKGGRFFAYLHTIDPHVPYSPPAEFRKMYWDRKYNGPIKSRSTGDQLAEIKTGKLSVSADDKRYLEALYDGEVSFNDHHFGRLIEGLKARGLYDNTIVVIIADHGEEFWDHGSVGHGHSLHEEMIHSPLVVRYPNMVASGRRLPHVVSMVDLKPTLLDALGVKRHDALEGVGFLDAFDGVGLGHPRVAISDFLYRKKSIRAGRYRWVTTGRDGVLYDAVGDGRDAKNLIDDHAIGLAFVRSHLGVFMGAADKTRWWERDRKAARKIQIEADNLDEIDDETRAMLEAMGYVEGAKGAVEDGEGGEGDEGEEDQGDKE